MYHSFLTWTCAIYACCKSSKFMNLINKYVCQFSNLRVHIRMVSTFLESYFYLLIYLLFEQIFFYECLHLLLPLKLYFAICMQFDIASNISYTTYTSITPLQVRCAENDHVCELPLPTAWEDIHTQAGKFSHSSYTNPIKRPLVSKAHWKLFAVNAAVSGQNRHIN